MAYVTYYRPNSYIPFLRKVIKSYGGKAAPGDSGHLFQSSFRDVLGTDLGRGQPSMVMLLNLSMASPSISASWNINLVLSTVWYIWSDQTQRFPLMKAILVRKPNVGSTSS